MYSDEPEITYFKFVSLLVQELDLKVDEAFIWDIVKLVDILMQPPNSGATDADRVSKMPSEPHDMEDMAMHALGALGIHVAGTAQENTEQSSKTYVKMLHLHPLL